MSSSQFSKAPKGQMKCNQCRESCALKNGDWFVSDDSTGQQIFLCKPCEQKANGAYKRPHPVRR